MYLINQQKIREINMKVTLLTREVNRIVSKTQINHGTNHNTDGLQNWTGTCASRCSPSLSKTWQGARDLVLLEKQNPL